MIGIPKEYRKTKGNSINYYYSKMFGSARTCTTTKTNKIKQKHEKEQIKDKFPIETKYKIQKIHKK